MKKFFGYFTRHKIVSGVLLIIIVSGGYFWYKKAHAVKGVTRYVTDSAVKGTVTVGVTGTGQVSASQQVDLKPGGSGTVISVSVKESQQVTAGTVIATLDEKSASVQVSSARAAVSQALANYDKVVAGTTGTDLALDNLTLSTAQTAIDTAKKNYDQTVLDQQKAVDKARLAMLTAGIALEASDTLSTVAVTLTGNYSGTAQGAYHISIYQGQGGMEYSVLGLSNQMAPITRGLAQPLGSGLYITFGSTGTISPTTTWTINLPNIKSSAYTDASNAFSSAQDAQAKTVQQAADAITSAQNAYTTAQLQYNQKVAPPAKADIATAQAQVDSARASLANAQTAYDNNILKAPFDGVVAKLDIHVGDQASASTAAATMITKEQIAQISLNEVDISKIKIGQKATMTFDAVDGLSMTGTVAQVDSIGTVSQGVVNYSVTISLDSEDDRVKPGMSVSTNIITDVATDVLTVPNSAVKSNGSGSYVQELDSSGKPQNKNVQVGLSNDSVTEIKSGLSEGENVVTQTIAPSTTAAAATSSASGRIPGLTGGAGGTRTGGAGFSGAAGGGFTGTGR